MKRIRTVQTRRGLTGSTEQRRPARLLPALAIHHLPVATVVRLQTIVARELDATDTAVVTVGTIHAGTVANVIPDRAELQVSVRSFSTDVRRRVLDAIERIVHAEADASGAPRPPEVELLGGADPAAFEGLEDIDAIRQRVDQLPSNHSPHFAPVIEPTLTTGVDALVAAARAWLDPDDDGAGA